MSETKKTDEHAAPAAKESHEVPPLSGAEAKDMIKHIDDIVAGAKKDFSKLMETKKKKLGQSDSYELTDAEKKDIAQPSEGKLIAFNQIAAEIATAEHEMDKNKPLMAISNEARIAYERAVEEKAAAEYRMHTVVHGRKWYDPQSWRDFLMNLDVSRAWNVARRNPVPTAVGAGLAGYGAIQLATSSTLPSWLAWIQGAVAGAPEWVLNIGNAGIIGGGAIAGGLVGRLLGGYIAKKTGVDAKMAKTTGTVLGAGGTALALSFAVPGGQLALAGAGGLWLGWKLVKMGWRRYQKHKLHLTPDMEAIEKERKRIEVVYDDADPPQVTSGFYDFKKKEYDGVTRESMDKLHDDSIEATEEENKSLERALDQEKKLKEAVAKLAETKDKKEAREAREAAETASSEMIRSVKAAERFAEKMSGKDKKTREKARAEARTLQEELDQLDTLIRDMKPEDSRAIKAAQERAKAAVKAAAEIPVLEGDVDESTPGVVLAPPGTEEGMKAEDAESLLKKAEESMSKLRGLIETWQVESGKREHEVKMQEAKATGDTALKQPLFKARADYLTERTNRLKAPRGVPRETIDQLRYLSDARNTLTALQMLRNGHRQGDAKYWEDNKATYGLLRDELQRLEVMPIAATVPDAKNAVTGVLRAFTPHPGSTDAHFDDPAALDSAVQRAAATIDVSRGTLEAPPAP